MDNCEIVYCKDLSRFGYIVNLVKVQDSYSVVMDSPAKSVQVTFSLKGEYLGVDQSLEVLRSHFFMPLVEPEVWGCLGFSVEDVETLMREITAIVNP